MIAKVAKHPTKRLQKLPRKKSLRCSDFIGLNCSVFPFKKNVKIVILKPKYYAKKGGKRKTESRKARPEGKSERFATDN